jgi:hypothetical protein
MTFGQISRLMTGGYSFEIQFKNTQERKTRFSNEQTFIDVWDGKRGFTFGIYNPRTHQMFYQRPRTIEQVERILIETTKK